MCLNSVLWAQADSQKRLDSLEAVYCTLKDTDTNKVLICNKIASDHYHNDSTISWSDSLLRLAQLNDMPLYTAKAYCYYSWSYSQMDDYETALLYNYRALLLADSIGDLRTKAWNYYKMAGTYYYLSNIELSDRYYHDAMSYYKLLNDTVWVTNCMRAMAENYCSRKCTARLSLHTGTLLFSILWQESGDACPTIIWE